MGKGREEGDLCVCDGYFTWKGRGVDGPFLSVRKRRIMCERGVSYLVAGVAGQGRDAGLNGAGGAVHV